MAGTALVEEVAEEQRSIFLRKTCDRETGREKGKPW